MPPETETIPDTITLKLVEYGEDTVTVDRAEYEAAKAAGELAEYLDTYASDIDSDWWVIEPDGSRVDPQY